MRKLLLIGGLGAVAMAVRKILGTFRRSPDLTAVDGRQPQRTVEAMVRAVDERRLDAVDGASRADVLAELLPVQRDVVRQVHVVGDGAGGSHVGGPASGDGNELAVARERVQPFGTAQLVGEVEEACLL